MALVSVDVEADGPCPALWSMISFGAVVVEPGLSRVFKGLTAPVVADFRPEVLAISGVTREAHEAFPAPEATMVAFKAWLEGLGERVVFISDNPAFDWQFINYYLHRFTGSNPFGHSARRIGDLYAGWKGDARRVNDWKRLRVTTHTHDPLDDARGNAEALLSMREQGLILPISS